MYIAFFEDNYIFVDNFNTSSRSYQPIPWNCNYKIWEAEGPRAEENKYPICTVIIFYIKYNTTCAIDDCGL